ncbi:MAG: hypothetical protein ACTSR2_02380 [Candidatus Hodarchaeales archaeon]
MVEKPDVYICQNKECGHRFQKAKFVTVEEDGIYITKPSCPKCGSTDLISSAWLIRE